METLMNILVVGLMWGGFTVVRKRPDIKESEFYLYLGAMIFVVLLIGFYYSIYQLLWGGLALSTGVAFGLGWNRHIEEK